MRMIALLLILLVQCTAKLYGTEEYFDKVLSIRGKCGQLCETNNSLQVWEFMKFSTAQNIENAGLKIKEAKKWRDFPSRVRKLFSSDRNLHYFDSSAKYTTATTTAEEEDLEYTDELLAGIRDLISRNESHKSIYTDGPSMISQAADYLNVTDKNVLVIGTEFPWIEAILQSRKPRKGVTIEYSPIKSSITGWEFLTPEEFRKRFLSGSLETFDIVFTYSSPEHSGLGRYGDSLNPWADLMSIGEAWCVSGYDASLVIGVPTTSAEIGAIWANVHRIYGNANYPHLVTNWRYKWRPHNYSLKPSEDLFEYKYQPLYVFSKLDSSP